MLAKSPRPATRTGRRLTRLIPPLVLTATLPFLLGPAGQSQPAPSQHEDKAITRTTPLITGVQIHLGALVEKAGYQPAQTMTALHALDIVSVRDNITWPMLKGIPGSGIAARLPGFSEVTHRSDLGPPLLTPHGTLSTMDGGDLPHSPQALQAFGKFVGDTATAWKGRGALFEIWNEWDKGARKGDHGTPEGYVALVKAAAPGIRKSAPDGKILAGGAADDGPTPFRWTKAMIDAGGLDSADALSVHLYDHCAPKLVQRAADEMMARLDDLHGYVAQHAPAKANAIYVSEFGWPTQGQCGVAPQVVAENVAQFILAASTRPWIRGVWYYELKDSGHDPAEREDNFGLLTYDYRPKPAACAYHAAADIVRNSKPVHLVRDGAAVRVDYAGKDGTVSAIWLADRSRPMQFQTDAATAQPMCGNASPAGTGWAGLTAMPIMLRGKSGAAPKISFKPA
jgi:hypothetical protein